MKIEPDTLKAMAEWLAEKGFKRGQNYAGIPVVLWEESPDAKTSSHPSAGFQKQFGIKLERNPSTMSRRLIYWVPHEVSQQLFAAGYFPE